MKGVFLDYPDIDEHGFPNTGDLFRGMRGFYTTLEPTPSGARVPMPRLISRRCIRYLVDGYVVPWGRVPRYTHQLSAMEIYLHPDSVPPEVMRSMVRFSRGVDVRHCDAIVFWTVYAPHK